MGRERKVPCVAGSVKPSILGELLLGNPLELTRLGVEGGDFSIIGLPEVFALVESELWGGAGGAVWVVRIH